MTYRIHWTLEQRQKFVRRWLAFRKKYGLTQQQLAEAMGIHVATVHRVERGRYVPNNDTVLRFSEVEKKFKAGEETERSLAWTLSDTEEI
jgi:transcriptional regulator with XRE-family HTH domain